MTPTAPRRRERRLSTMAFAAIGWLIAVVGGIGALALRRADPAPVLPNTFGMDDQRMLVFAILGIAWATVGAILVVKRPENSVGRYVLLIGAAYGLSIMCGAVTFSAWAEGSENGRRVATTAAWLTVLTTAFTGLVLYVPLIFPTGRTSAPRADAIRRFFLVSLIAFWIGVLIQPGPLQLFRGIENPFGIGPDLRGRAGLAIAPILLIWAAVAIPIYVWAIASRYRHAGSVERQQLKWFLAALGATLVSLVITAVIGVSGYGSSAIPLAICGLSSTLIPISIAIAILRYRNYEIDRIISRTISYAVVTGILAVVFVGAILLLQAPMAEFTGGQTIAVAASTLVVFALFRPVLRRVRHAIDRRFDRARYDAERTSGEFSERLRWQTDIDLVTGDLVRTASAAVVPASLGIWLREPGSRR